MLSEKVIKALMDECLIILKTAKLTSVGRAWYQGRYDMANFILTADGFREPPENNTTLPSFNDGKTPGEYE